MGSKDKGGRAVRKPKAQQNKKVKGQTPASTKDLVERLTPPRPKSN